MSRSMAPADDWTDQITTALCGDVCVVRIGGALRERTIVGLHHAIAIVAIAKSEHAPFPACGVSRAIGP